MDALLGSDPPLHREDWHQIKWWYRAAVERAPPPAQVTLERITAERVELYSYVPPPRANTPVFVDPLPVDGLVPTEDDIEWDVKRLRNHRFRGGFGDAGRAPERVASGGEEEV